MTNKVPKNLKALFNKIKILLGGNYVTVEIDEETVGDLYAEAADEFFLISARYLTPENFDSEFSEKWIEKMCVALAKKTVYFIRSKYPLNVPINGKDISQEHQNLYSDSLREIEFLRELLKI